MKSSSQLSFAMRRLVAKRFNVSLTSLAILGFWFVVYSIFLIHWRPKSSTDILWETEQFIFRSLMDPMPRPLAKSSSSFTSSDIGSFPVDKIIIYPTAHTDDNAHEIVDGVDEARESLSVEISGKVTSAEVVIHDVKNEKLDPPIPNFSGTSYTFDLLEKRGITDNVKILPGWHEEFKSMNSLNELEKLVRYCREKEIDALVIVSTPFHIPRSFLTGLSVASRIYPNLKVYAKAAKPRYHNYWEKVVAHSQGTLIKARKDLVASEMDRIHNYILKGDLMPVKEALLFLEQRDTF